MIGRFITPDTIVQAPFDPQSLNRYSYVRNNPLNLIDPTGHFWFLVAAIILGGLTAWGKTSDRGQQFWQRYGDFISPLGRAIVTGDWKGFGYQALNILGIVAGVTTGNPWLVASAALSYTSRATANIGGKTSREISRALGYAAIATAVIGTGIEIGKAFSNSASASNTATPQESLTTATNEATKESTSVYGKLTVSVKRGEGGIIRNDTGHAWITLQKEGTNPTSYGFGPKEQVGSLGDLIKGVPGELKKGSGFSDSYNLIADVSHTWDLTQSGFYNVANYVDNFDASVWSLSVECTDFAVGATKSVPISVPNVSNGAYSDPNKFGDWLETLN